MTYDERAVSLLDGITDHYKIEMLRYVWHLHMTPRVLFGCGGLFIGFDDKWLVLRERFVHLMRFLWLCS